jgi:diguanylate cyclase (GGDEF)-like protein
MEQTDVHNALAMMLVLLVLVLHRSAGQTRDILRENIAMSYSLNYRATHDPLVALLNRREFKNRFDTVQDQMAKDEIQAIIFIDLNNFKMLNDTYGHQAGDEALVEVSNIIRNSIRRSDVAARFGGDEFVIFMRASGLSDIEAVGQKIIDSIDLYTMPKSNPDAKLGASLGIAYTSNSGVSFETLLKVADQACYKAKKAGLDVPYSKLLEV